MGLVTNKNPSNACGCLVDLRTEEVVTKPTEESLLLSHTMLNMTLQE